MTNYGWVFSLEECLLTREARAEPMLSILPPLPEGEAESGEIRLDALDGRMVLKCTDPTGDYAYASYKLLHVDEHFIVQEIAHDLNFGHGYHDFTTKLYLIPRAQGQALADLEREDLEELISSAVFQRYVLSKKARRGWRTLSMSVSTGSSEGTDS